MSRMASLFFGVDPDFRKTAIAVFRKSLHHDTNHKDLIDLRVVESSEFSIPNVAYGAHSAIYSHLISARTAETLEVTVEDPQIYLAKGPARHGDIMRLAQIAAAVASVASMFPDVRAIRMPTPQQWKGSVPKEIHQARILSRLGVPYDVVKGKTSGYCVPKVDGLGGAWAAPRAKGEWKHLVDAIGLALWGMAQAEDVFRLGIKTDTGNLISYRR